MRAQNVDIAALEDGNIGRRALSHGIGPLTTGNTFSDRNFLFFVDDVASSLSLHRPLSFLCSTRTCLWNDKQLKSAASRTFSLNSQIWSPSSADKLKQVNLIFVGISTQNRFILIFLTWPLQIAVLLKKSRFEGYPNIVALIVDDYTTTAQFILYK